MSVDERCHEIGISQAAFCAWKNKLGGLGVLEFQRLRQLEEGNRKLKQLVVDLNLDKAMLARSNGLVQRTGHACLTEANNASTAAFRFPTGNSLIAAMAAAQRRC